MVTTYMRPRVGQPAPMIALPALGGGRWSLDEHRGKTVVAIFHRHLH